MDSILDPPPTCRVCGHQGKVSLATWVRNDEAVKNWYLCDRHVQLVIGSGNVFHGSFTQLPNAAEARRQNREAGV